MSTTAGEFLNITAASKRDTLGYGISPESQTWQDSNWGFCYTPKICISGSIWEWLCSAPLVKKPYVGFGGEQPIFIISVAVPSRLCYSWQCKLQPSSNSANNLIPKVFKIENHLNKSSLKLCAFQAFREKIMWAENFKLAKALCFFNGKFNGIKANGKRKQFSVTYLVCCPLPPPYLSRTLFI